MLKKFGLTLFSLSNVQDVVLLGKMPEDLGQLGEGILKFPQSRRLGEVPSLDALLGDEQPTVAATLVAQGLPTGILVSSGSEATLSEDWWGSSDYYEVCVFCFSCFSADYLSISDLWRMITGAIGFEGPIWISVSDGGRHLVPFLKKVRSILRQHGKDLEQSLADIMKLYAQMIRRRSLARLWKGEEGGELYLRRISILRQMKQIRLLPARGRL